MNIKIILASLQNIIITLLVQSGLLLLIWNIVVPTLNLSIVGTINYGQAFLLIILTKIFKYDPLALANHHNIALIATVKELEFARQQQLDAMIFNHQQKLQESNTDQVSKNVD